MAAKNSVPCPRWRAKPFWNCGSYFCHLGLAGENTGACALIRKVRLGRRLGWRNQGTPPENGCFSHGRRMWGTPMACECVSRSSRDFVSEEGVSPRMGLWPACPVHVAARFNPLVALLGRVRA